MGSIRQAPSGRWQARYRDPNGRLRSRTFPTKTEARRFLERTGADQQRGEWIDPSLGRVTFGEWAEAWSQTIVDLRPATVDQNLRLLRLYILPAFGSVPLARITPLDVRAWLAQLAADPKLSSSTVRKIGQVFRKVMNSAVDSGFIVRSPARGVKLPAEATREMMFLTAGQVADLADSAHPHYRCLIYAAAYTGLRWGELAGLTVERLNLMQCKLQVVEQLSELNGELSWAPPKTAAGRRAISLPAFLVSMLEEQLAVPVVQETGLVFPSPTGRPMRRNSFWATVWRPAIRVAGLDGLRFHDLRHTCVALLISQGAHPKAVQEHMGHSSITVTYDRYGHLFPAIADQLAERLDAVYQEAATHTPVHRADVRELTRT